MNSGIYKITNEVTGKFYIGSTNDIDKRWYDHKRELRLNIHANPRLQNSWNKHGGEKFTFLLLEEVEPIEEKLFTREQWYLDTFKPYTRGIGYNICDKATGGDNITYNPNRDAFIQKMKEVTSGEKNGMFGKEHSEEAIKAQKEKAKGRFTLPWFVERYGQEEGMKKYDERRHMLANRKMNYSRPNPNKGKSLGWNHKDGWLERREQTNKYLDEHYEEFKDMVFSGKYTQRELSEKLGITRITLRRHIRKMGDHSTTSILNK